MRDTLEVAFPGACVWLAAAALGTNHSHGVVRGILFIATTVMAVWGLNMLPMKNQGAIPLRSRPVQRVKGTYLLVLGGALTALEGILLMMVDVDQALFWVMLGMIGVTALLFLFLLFIMGALRA